MDEILETTGVVTEPNEAQENGDVENKPAEHTETPPDDSSEIERDAEIEEIRNNAEATAQENKELKAQIERTNKILGRASQSESPDLELVANVLGIDQDVLKAEIDEEMEGYRAITEAESAKEELARIKAEQAMQRDLLEIQKVDPNVTDLNDLGESFLKCIGAGMSAVEAYHASKYVADKTSSTPPPEIGKVNQSNMQKEFFSKEEVEKMSAVEVEKNLEKIEKSMSKWN